MIPIQNRPAEVEKRNAPWHWEGDLVVGTLHRSAIATIVDRARRFLLLVHLDADHNAETVSEGLITTMGPLLPALRRTLTWDQGVEMSMHRRVATMGSAPVPSRELRQLSMEVVAERRCGWRFAESGVTESGEDSLLHRELVRADPASMANGLDTGNAHLGADSVASNPATARTVPSLGVRSVSG